MHRRDVAAPERQPAADLVIDDELRPLRRPTSLQGLRHPSPHRPLGHPETIRDQHHLFAGQRAGLAERDQAPHTSVTQRPLLAAARHEPPPKIRPMSVINLREGHLSDSLVANPLTTSWRNLLTSTWRPAAIQATTLSPGGGDETRPAMRARAGRPRCVRVTCGNGPWR